MEKNYQAHAKTKNFSFKEFNRIKLLNESILNRTVLKEKDLSRPSILLNITNIGSKQIQKDCSLTNVKIDIGSYMISLLVPLVIYWICKKIFTYRKKKKKKSIMSEHEYENSTAISKAHSEYIRMSNELKEKIFESPKEFDKFYNAMIKSSFILKTNDPELFRKIRIRNISLESKVLYYYDKDKLDKLYVSLQFYINILYFSEKSIKWYDVNKLSDKIRVLRPYKYQMSNLDSKILKLIKTKLRTLKSESDFKSQLEKQIIYLQERIDILNASDLCDFYRLLISSIEKKKKIVTIDLKKQLYYIEKSLRLLVPDFFNIFK